MESQLPPDWTVMDPELEAYRQRFEAERKRKREQEDVAIAEFISKGYDTSMGYKDKEEQRQHRLSCIEKRAQWEKDDIRRRELEQEWTDRVVPERTVNAYCQKCKGILARVCECAKEEWIDKQMAPPYECPWCRMQRCRYDCKFGLVH